MGTKTPTLRFALFTDDLPAGDDVAPQSAGESAKIELDPSVAPDENDPPRCVLAVGFKGVYRRHKVKVRVQDPNGKVVCEGKASRSGDSDSDLEWTAFISIVFRPQVLGTYFVDIGLDGKIICHRVIEVVVAGAEMKPLN